MKGLEKLSLMAMALAVASNSMYDLGRAPEIERSKLRCRNCAYYKDGKKYCKEVKRSINPNTPADKCNKFKNNEENVKGDCGVLSQQH